MCLYELDRVLSLRLLCFIILRPRQNGGRFADNIFKCNSLKQNLCILDYISPKVIVNSVIDSDKCLAPNRRQSNAWTNNDSVHWYRHASPGLRIKLYCVWLNSDDNDLDYIRNLCVLVECITRSTRSPVTWRRYQTCKGVCTRFLMLLWFDVGR